MNIELKEGLGDCIIAGAAIQEYARKTNQKIGFITNNSLEPLFKYHPNIEFLLTGQADKKLLWASQLRDIGINVYPAHTIQRFSHQLGFTIDPTKTLDIYNQNGKVVNRPLSKVVCINTHSKETTRRFIPDSIINLLESELKVFGYEPVFIGSCNRNSVQNINEMIDLLTKCKLFIGPVSFPYHLASALKCKSITFFSYMPYWKFSDFLNTIPIFSKRSCVADCEEFERKLRVENSCLNGCKAIDYDKDEVFNIIRKEIS